MRLPILGDGKPAWIAARAPGGGAFADVRAAVDAAGLSTVCEEARCPNLGVCWGERTATFLLMGRTCTRGCRFCHVRTKRQGEPLDDDEPARVAAAVRALGLRHCVLTSVDRDDLVDGGAAHLAACVRAVRDLGVSVEILAPDFGGREEDLAVVLAARPDVFAHNVETVERLTPTVRDPRASYERSILLLAFARRYAPVVVVKSGLMLGLGESDDEILEAIDDLIEAGVDALTLGQYLRPSLRHLPVARYAPPATFETLARSARQRGIVAVAAGPLVRSSYRAAALLDEVHRTRAGPRPPEPTQ